MTAGTRLTLTQSPDRPALDELIARARTHVMTPAERAAQRRSWVIGELMIEHPEYTREHAEKLYEDAAARLGFEP